MNVNFIEHEITVEEGDALLPNFVSIGKLNPAFEQFWNPVTGQLLGRWDNGDRCGGLVQYYLGTPPRTVQCLHTIRQACDDIADGAEDASPRDKFANSLFEIIHEVLPMTWEADAEGAFAAAARERLNARERLKAS